MMKLILVISIVFQFSIVWAESAKCVGFYRIKSATFKENQFDPDQNVKIKKFEANAKGEIVSIDVQVRGEIHAGESAVKISNLLRQSGHGAWAKDVSINLTSDIALKGKGEFFGFELDISAESSKTNFTLNLEQNISKIENDQTFVSLLTESGDTSRMVVNLSGEVKEMDKKGKYEQQRCKGT